MRICLGMPGPRRCHYRTHCTHVGRIRLSICWPGYRILQWRHPQVHQKRYHTSSNLSGYWTPEKYHVPVKLNILIGTSPLETKATIRDTLKRAKALKVDQVMFNIVSPFPGTEFYDMARKNGWIVTGDYLPTDVQRNSILSYPHLSAEEMEKLLFRNNLSYFLSPHFVISQIRRFKSWKEFTYALKALKIKLFG